MISFPYLMENNFSDLADMDHTVFLEYMFFNLDGPNGLNFNCHDFPTEMDSYFTPQKAMDTSSAGRKFIGMGDTFCDL